jgi:hypothetical protein
VLSAVGFAMKGEAFWQSYLIAYYFWIGLTIGSMAVLMVQYLSGGAWGLVGRRIFEAGTRTLPLMAVLFIPIALKMTTLYSWARPEALHDENIQTKVLYLNPKFFVLRAVLYFVIWGVFIFLLNKWSREQDGQPTQLPGPRDRRLRVLSGPGLVVYVLTITFMSVDWVMSLDPHWSSTIFGVLTLGGQGLATLAFTLMVLSAFVKHRPLAGVVSTENIHDLAKLMFAFVLLWAYFAVSQLIIIWSGNLPEEIPFYLERLHGPWAPISIVVLLGQFVLPFLLLLSRGLKQDPMKVVVARFRRDRRDGRPVADVLLAQPGRPGDAAGARSVLQGSDGSWRTLSTRMHPPPCRSKATASATAASSGSSSCSWRRSCSVRSSSGGC